MSEFHFLRPSWLLALLPFVLLVWWNARGDGRSGGWARCVDEALRPHVMLDEHSTLGGRRAPLLVLAGLLAVLALAGPTWQRIPVPVFREESALVIALDLSQSMNAADIAPSRLVRARYRLADLLRARRDGQTALVVFAAQAFVVTPLTDDTQTLAGQLQDLDTSIMPSQGSEPAAAIELAAELVHQAGGGPGHVLLVTDGAEPDSLARATAAAARAGLAVSVLGVGTGGGAPIPDRSGGFLKRDDGQLVMSTLDAGALATFATEHGGLYLDVGGDDTDLARLERHLQAALASDAERRADLSSNQWEEAGPWLLLPLLVLAALGFRRGALFALVLALPLVPPPVLADWWRTDDQAGAAAFAAGDYDAAGHSFADQAWRGAARYRAGDYAAAAADLAEDDSARGHYNRGNALARLGRYDEAIAAYDRALELTPGDDDAAHNKELVEKLLEQQQQQQDNTQQQQGQDDNEEAGAGERAQDEQSQGEGGSQGGQPQPSDQAQSDGDAGGESNAEQPQAEPPQGDQGEDESEQAQPAPDPTDSEDGEETRTARAEQAEDGDESDAERAQATEQWLRQIPDDPGGLLRRKFQYLYKQRYGDEPYAGDRW
ncbi:MAG: VWA domain-containing protein [Gammaproteobacteria bacterium]